MPSPSKIYYSDTALRGNTLLPVASVDRTSKPQVKQYGNSKSKEEKFG